MDGRICYLTTDLDLKSSDELTELAAAIGSAGAPSLHIRHGEDGTWYATFETEGAHDQPEFGIDVMVKIAETLQEPLRSVWSRCTLREFNIGYDCGNEPRAFTQGLSSGLLGRMAGVGASLRVTLYPDRDAQAKGGGAPKPNPT